MRMLSDAELAQLLDKDIFHLIGDVADQLHVFKSEHSACRVSRREAADSFCLRCDSSLDEISLSPVISVFCVSCDRNDNARYLVAECVVVCIERLSYDNFIARVKNSCERENKSLGTSVCDEDVFSLIFHAVVSLHVADHGIEELCNTA